MITKTFVNNLTNKLNLFNKLAQNYNFILKAQSYDENEDYGMAPAIPQELIKNLNKKPISKAKKTLENFLNNTFNKKRAEKSRDIYVMLYSFLNNFIFYYNHYMSTGEGYNTYIQSFNTIKGLIDGTWQEEEDEEEVDQLSNGAVLEKLIDDINNEANKQREFQISKTSSAEGLAARKIKDVKKIDNYNTYSTVTEQLEENYGQEAGLEEKIKEETGTGKIDTRYSEEGSEEGSEELAQEDEGIKEEDTELEEGEEESEDENKKDIYENLGFGGGDKVRSDYDGGGEDDDRDRKPTQNVRGTYYIDPKQKIETMKAKLETLYEDAEKNKDLNKDLKKDYQSSNLVLEELLKPNSLIKQLEEQLINKSVAKKAKNSAQLAAVSMKVREIRAEIKSKLEIVKKLIKDLRYIRQKNFVFQEYKDIPFKIRNNIENIFKNNPEIYEEIQDLSSFQEENINGNDLSYSGFADFVVAENTNFNNKVSENDTIFIYRDSKPTLNFYIKRVDGNKLYLKGTIPLEEGGAPLTNQSYSIRKAVKIDALNLQTNNFIDKIIEKYNLLQVIHPKKDPYTPEEIDKIKIILKDAIKYILLKEAVGDIENFRKAKEFARGGMKGKFLKKSRVILHNILMNPTSSKLSFIIGSYKDLRESIQGAEKIERKLVWQAKEWEGTAFAPFKTLYENASNMFNKIIWLNLFQMVGFRSSAELDMEFKFIFGDAIALKKIQEEFNKVRSQIETLKTNPNPPEEELNSLMEQQINLQNLLIAYGSVDQNIAEKYRYGKIIGQRLAKDLLAPGQFAHKVLYTFRKLVDLNSEIYGLLIQGALKEPITPAPGAKSKPIEPSGKKELENEFIEKINELSKMKSTIEKIKETMMKIYSEKGYFPLKTSVEIKGKIEERNTLFEGTSLTYAIPTEVESLIETKKVNLLPKSSAKLFGIDSLDTIMKNIETICNIYQK